MYRIVTGTGLLPALVGYLPEWPQIAITIVSLSLIV
jgi:hypothetical protein